ncbi:MAG: GNAT family N-acetyltransferase [Christensenellaceae bacterium]|nr:GNAT family N-acetyltransferase [Christensenellaceae bacterium]
MIRQAREEDIFRIAEIVVFSKRVNYFPIFGDEWYSFSEMQVVTAAEHYREKLSELYVFCENGIIKGMIRIRGEEICELYTEYMLRNQGIGSALIAHAKEKGCSFLWALEKNTAAQRFYARHGFFPSGEKKLEEGTTEYLIKLVKKEGLSL